MTHVKALVSLMACLAVAAAACGGGEAVDNSDPGGDGTRPSLAGLWELTDLTVDGVGVALPDGAALEMTIEAGRIGGSGGCNSFGGSIDAADDGTLSLVEVAWTEMACAQRARMDFESTYLGALVGVNRWEADPTGISFLSDGAILRYSPGADPIDLALEGTSWQFDTIFSGDGVARAASSTDQSVPQVSLTITGGSAVLSADGCDDVTFHVNHEGGAEGNLALPDPSQLQTGGCDSPNMTDAIAGIEAATGYTISETRLTLIGLPGETISFAGLS